MNAPCRQNLLKFAEASAVIKYFLMSYTDLFGGTARQAGPGRGDRQDAWRENGAGFAGFATWLDMTPAMPDMLRDSRSAESLVIQLPWKRK